MTVPAATPADQTFSRAFRPTPPEETHVSLSAVLRNVRQAVAPVWPLRDFVAVNPFAGMSTHSFRKTRNFLQLFSDCELLMPLPYYRSRFEQGQLSTEDIRLALDELAGKGLTVATLLSPADVVDVLLASESNRRDDSSTNAHVGRGPSGRRVELLSETYDRYFGTCWSGTFLEEVSRFCAAHYDSGQSAWKSPWKALPLYQAWRPTAQLDRRVEVLGLEGFRQFVAQVPCSSDAALSMLLDELRVPPGQWELLLYRTAFSMPGWSAWVKYQTVQDGRKGVVNDDFTGLLAMRLAYDAALLRAGSFHTDWAESSRVHAAWRSGEPYDDSLVRFILLRASELAYRQQLVNRLATRLAGSEPRNYADTGTEGGLSPVHGWEPAPANRPLAQLVFCIDVRSERYRRHLESVSESINTFGFAGFFGAPFEFVTIGEDNGAAQVPALLTPRFKVYEGLRDVRADTLSKVVDSRRFVRSVSKAWKGFQTSAISSFGFVETAGLLSGLALWRRSAGLRGRTRNHECDGISNEHRHLRGPSLDQLDGQGLTIDRQVTLAVSILRGIGITENFARLVVFCGHGSQTENNPLQAGLDCGACGGHSGEPNARFAASLLNNRAVRKTLVDHGIMIPDDVHFLAALHNTTNDELTFFDADVLPETHQADLKELAKCTVTASQQTRLERLPLLATTRETDPRRRAIDWSETRPEWGLSGNAAFVVGPRSLTRSIDLEGRVFLHSYDHRKDAGCEILEQIMTAPMVVAHWINMQYYASTVDNRHFGSGNKTIHNVVGQFGVFAGNGGDLTTGLPWQSLHDGTSYQHEPLRLLSVIAAPRSAIDTVVAKHSLLDDLLSNDWLNLLALDDGRFYHYSAMAGWRPVESAVEQVDTGVAPHNQWAAEVPMPCPK